MADWSRALAVGGLMARGEKGFTLVETVVALAIGAGVLSVLVKGFAGNWQGATRARSSALALSIAKSQFALAGLETPLADGQTFSGREGGVGWTLHVRRRPAPDGDMAPPAYWLDFEAAWSGGLPVPRRSLHLRSLKIGAAS